jgi:RES domain-containing protein
MILTRLENITAYRMHTPKWASQPTSGLGAAKSGGRLNRPGIEALYLSLERETAILEYQRLSELLPPGLLVSYLVTIGLVVDFRQGYHPTKWDPMWEDFYCDWRELWFNQHIEPPSWLIGDTIMSEGAKGVIFHSSLEPSGTNLVLYPKSYTDLDSIEVYDPNQSLPKNQASWT